MTHQTVGESCTDCHAFGGPATTAHNAVFDGGGGFATDSPSAETRTDCVMCHTEHKGKDANIAPMKDAQCNSCHQSTVSSFSRDHPAFAAGFPHDRRGSIQFNHVNHFSQYFPKELAEDKQPTCVTCHDVQRAGLDVPPGSFEQNCASCHLEGITDRSLRLITLPYLEEDPFDMDQVAEVCGPTPDQVEFLRARAEGGDPDEVEFDEYFYEDWGDYLSPPMALMLGAPPDDNYEYNEPVGEFFMALAESGLEPMVERLEAVPGDARPERLLAGLDGELLRRAACAWMQKMEYEAPSELTGGGWQSEGVSVSYRPTGHADPIARAWFDFAVNAPRAAEAAGADEIVIEQAELLQTTLLGDTGLGNCAKCHAVTEVTDKSGEGGEDAAKLMVEWGYQPVEDRPYVQYDHGPHVNLLGPGTLCATCHKLNPEADYAASFKHFDATDFAPGFKPIGKETCTQCHTEAKVRQDCQLCHEYHLEPGFIRTMGFQQTAQEPERPGQDGG
ncbi:cytochrome c3 family protein [Minwuia thermotolerans]|uniref:cytochrome c3 family protein n=1 Tax=Minwuia thermotolerans TaxID=2056226 RepID=UPI000F63A50B|nr:cytochrome c3 family protein [Minwuia thermotolerans]